MIGALVAFLGAGAFLHVQAADEEKEGGEEDGA